MASATPPQTFPFGCWAAVGRNRVWYWHKSRMVRSSAWRPLHLPKLSLLGGLMATDAHWQCLLDTGAWLEPRLSPVVTLDNLTAGECCSACIQAQHCATFELSAGRCSLSGDGSASAAGTEPTRGVVLTVSYERAAPPATGLPRRRRRRRRLQQRSPAATAPCLAWEPFRLGALYASCGPLDSSARRCTDFLGAARRAACMAPQLPPARLALQECVAQANGEQYRRPIALRIAQANDISRRYPVDLP